MRPKTTAQPLSSPALISRLSSNLVNGAAHSGGPQAAGPRAASGRRADAAAGEAESPLAAHAAAAQALADAADGALSQITDSLQRMRMVAKQAGESGVYGSGGLKAQQTRIAQQNNGIDTTVTASLFNGQPLLDGRMAAQATQEGEVRGANQRALKAVALYDSVQRQA